MDSQYFSGQEGVNKQKSKVLKMDLQYFTGGSKNKIPKVLEMDLQYFSGKEG